MNEKAFRIHQIKLQSISGPNVVPLQNDFQL